MIEVIQRGSKVGELLSGWSETLAEMPRLTVFFNELEFSQAREIGARRTDLPVGPVMDLLLDLVDRTMAAPRVLVVGSTSHPETIRPAFVLPARAIALPIRSRATSALPTWSAITPIQCSACTFSGWTASTFR